MRTTTLGRTGLRVGVAGLGSGGHSMLGQGTGASPARSVAIVERALDLGVTFFDTAPVYGTEEIVGKGIAGKRDSVVLSTKSLVIPPGAPVTGDRLISGADLARNIDVSLARLGTDYVDILHLHGVTPGQYERCRDELVPALLKLRDQGKIRFLGITERFIIDPQHRMLTQAVGDDCWDVMMVGFNLINPSARDRVLARTLENNIATLVMFAVRRVLSRPEALREMIADLVTKGLIADDQIPATSPLRAVYNDPVFRAFLAGVLGIEQLHPYADEVSSINVHFADKGRELGWHFDNSAFAVTMLLRAPEGGGAFEYVPDVRDADAGDMAFDRVAAVLDGSESVHTLRFDPGALVLFRGRNALHRVTPTEGAVARLLVVFAYNDQPGVKLSESALQTFYGRTA